MNSLFVYKLLHPVDIQKMAKRSIAKLFTLVCKLQTYGKQVESFYAVVSYRIFQQEAQETQSAFTTKFINFVCVPLEHHKLLKKLKTLNVTKLQLD